MIGLSILRVVPVWAWALAALLAWGGFQKYRATSATQKAERATAAAVIATKTAQAEQAEREREFQFSEQARKAADEYARHVARQKAAAAGARAELDSLRDAIAASPASPACTGASAPRGIDAAGGTFRELFGSCAATLQSLAQEADRLEGKLTGLQSYVQSIQVPQAQKGTP